MADTVFSKILRGEIPVQRVYEDDQVLAFLDIAPLSDGHILVIPKEEVATMDALSEESAAAIGRVLPRLCRAVRTATGCSDYNILQNNGVAAHQAVMHVHFHVIPKTEAGDGLGIGWPTRPLDPTRGAELAQQISEALAAERTG